MTNSSEKKAPVSVFYAKQPEKKTDQDRSKKTSHRKGQGRFESRSNDSEHKARSDFKGSVRGRENKDEKKEGRFSSRIESFTSKNKTELESPWKTKPSKFNHERSGKGYSSGDRIANRSNYSAEKKPFNKEQKSSTVKNELYVYGENSCKAIATKRADSIIKVFIIETMLDRFRDLLAILAQDKIGYDIVPAQQIERLTQTPHHGGIAMIVKRRKGLSASEYLNKEKYAKVDSILAIDDIANPHNLGGIARTAAFFSLNALMVRQPEMAENSAAIKVSEGGMESLELIKAEDMIADLAHLKKSGYKIIAILPVKTQSIKSIALEKAKFNPTKTVFVIFQQINEKITDLADDIISLQGSKEMSALNISVLTGIVLSTWRNRLHQSY